MSSDPKNYFGFTFDEFTEYTVNIAQLNLGTAIWDRRSWPQIDLMPVSQKYSPKSDWNPQSNLLKVFGVSLQMSSDAKKYFGFTFDEFGDYFWLPGIQ